MCSSSVVYPSYPPASILPTVFLLLYKCLLSALLNLQGKDPGTFSERPVGLEGGCKGGRAQLGRFLHLKYFLLQPASYDFTVVKHNKMSHLEDVALAVQRTSHSGPQ